MSKLLLSRRVREVALELVSVSPDAELTLFQVADLLNVSVPFVVALVKAGKLSASPDRQRLRVADVLTYKKLDDERRRGALAELTAEAEELGEYFGPEKTKKDGER